MACPLKRLTNRQDDNEFGRRSNLRKACVYFSGLVDNDATILHSGFVEAISSVGVASWLVAWGS